jgi:DNA-binding NarL/FixJ family response regulator
MEGAMTTVLIVDSDQDSRVALEAQLVASNQFERVVSCASLLLAESFIPQYEVKVMLIDAELASQSRLLHQIKANFPELGVVLLQGKTGVIDSATLLELGAHAQTSRLAAPIEIIASVAKALVCRLKPGTRILGKFLKDSK